MHEKNREISILIVTRNRPEHLLNCLRSLRKCAFKKYEILIGDQSTNDQTRDMVKSLHCNIRYFKMNIKGKTKGLNFLIKRSKNEILAFTDDDCIITDDWLGQIFRTYENNTQKLAGVFGSTLPHQPLLHQDMFCPSTCLFNKSAIYTYKNINYYELGLGNNMSIRKSVLLDIGGFKEWLGVGTFVNSGEESELIFRILRSGYVLVTNPKMIVFHNNWLTNKQIRLLELNNTRGFISFLSYYLFSSTWNHSVQFIHKKMRERTFPAFSNYYHMIKDQIKIFIKETVLLFLEVVAVVVAIIIGVYMMAVDIIKRLISNFVRNFN